MSARCRICPQSTTRASRLHKYFVRNVENGGMWDSIGIVLPMDLQYHGAPYAVLHQHWLQGRSRGCSGLHNFTAKQAIDAEKRVILVGSGVHDTSWFI